MSDVYEDFMRRSRSQQRGKQQAARGGRASAGSAVPARRGTAAPAVAEPLKWLDVEFVAPANTGGLPDSQLPPGWDDAEEAPSSFVPAANWQTPGEGFVGEYLGMQVEIGPNKSRLYAFKAADDQAVSIWGTTALDQRMDFLQPVKGDMLLVQYLGDQPTSRGMNPVKTFRVLRRK
jgi:hypothetical protein